MLEKLNERIRKVRAKLSRAVVGLGVAERRVKHHKKRLHRYEQAKNADAANRARRNLQKWQKRQTKMHDRRLFLQLLLHRRARKKAKWLKAHPSDQYPSTGVVEFDNHQVAAWIVHDILAPARAAGVWNGYVISGYRDPAYSESLCQHMCGAPSCPGTCAGRSSNHSGSVKPAGAVDLTDPAGAVRYAQSHGITFHGAGEMLPSDYPHCSSTGV